MTGIGPNSASYDSLIDVADLKALLSSAECRVMDCRFDLMAPDKGRTEYLAGHIPGALYADLDRDLAGPVTEQSGRHPLPDVADFKSTLERWGIGNDTQVVVYDYASGGLAARLWWMLRWLGHTKVAVLNGGLRAWRASDGELEIEVPDFPESDFASTADHGMVTTTEEISSAIAGASDLHLVDARDRPRFAGQTEPIDTVAGHVPGAVNFPFSEAVNADGTWKSVEELRTMWAKVLGSASPAPFSVMCGSGVTACHLVLSARLAGLDEPRVYVGSWSEWIRDESRPVAPELRV